MQRTGSGKSNMNEWSDGVAYTDLTLVTGEYVDSSNGAFISYGGWQRTGYVPCNGATMITIPSMGGAGSNPNYNAFYTKDKVFIKNFTIYHTQDANVSVPSNAYYFAISETVHNMTTIINKGITPHA